jgi:small GTP-binding protein
MSRDAFKVVVCGNSSVGKTSIVQRFCFNCFTAHTVPTLGADFMSRRVELPAGAVTLQIWDTAGQEQYQAIGALFFRSSSVAFIVYDVTSEGPLDEVRAWTGKMRSAEPEALIVVFGNKADLVGTATRDVANWCRREGIEHFFCSALSGSGIEEGFTRAAELLRAANPIVVQIPDRGSRRSECCK